MGALFLGQIIEQLANAGILSSSRGLFVEPAGFYLDGAGFLAYKVEAKRPHQSDRLQLHETFYVLAANERDVFSELLPVQLNQPPAMSGFFVAHAVEHGSGGGEVLAQSFCEIGEDAFVFFFERNGQGQNLALSKSLKVPHGG